MRHRKRWLEKFDGPYYTLWWLPVGHISTTHEAKESFDHLREYRVSEYAFSFSRVFPEPAE